MPSLQPGEIVRKYVEMGGQKADRSVGRTVLLAMLAGVLIALAGAASNTAAHAISNASVVRIIYGLLFPFGLGMVMILGAELFTGNCMLFLSVLEKKAAMAGVLRNLAVVCAGNFAGALLVAAGCAVFGQMDYSGGALALYTIQFAAGKCAIPFSNAVALGFFCNVAVCAGILCSLSADDTAGRILGAYIPAALFVICGFEHCVANMYYIPAGLFAMRVPQYAQMAAEAGIDVSMLTWGSFLLRNLLPVTAGNALGGISFGLVMWAGHLRNG